MFRLKKKSVIIFSALLSASDPSRIQFCLKFASPISHARKSSMIDGALEPPLSTTASQCWKKNASEIANHNLCFFVPFIILQILAWMQRNFCLKYNNRCEYMMAWVNVYLIGFVFMFIFNFYFYNGFLEKLVTKNFPLWILYVLNSSVWYSSGSYTLVSLATISFAEDSTLWPVCERRHVKTCPGSISIARILYLTWAPSRSFCILSYSASQIIFVLLLFIF